MNFLKNFANVLAISPCHCRLILHQFIRSFITTITICYSFLPVLTLNLLFP